MVCHVLVLVIVCCVFCVQHPVQWIPRSSLGVTSVELSLALSYCCCFGLNLMIKLPVMESPVCDLAKISTNACLNHWQEGHPAIVDQML